MASELVLYAARALKIIAGAVAGRSLGASGGVARQIETILEKITAEHLGYPPGGETIVGGRAFYRQLLMTPDVEIGVFELGAGAIMELHDHPGTVVTKVLAGAVQIVGFDLDPGTSLGERSVPGRYRGTGLLSSSSLYSAGTGGDENLPALGNLHTTTPDRCRLHAIRTVPSDRDAPGWNGGALLFDVVFPVYTGSRERSQAWSSPSILQDRSLCTYFACGNEGGTGKIDAFAFAERHPGASLCHPSTSIPVTLVPKRSGADHECLPSKKPELAVVKEVSRR